MVTALVVGGTGGIGAACVTALRAAGNDVVTADLAGADLVMDLATPEGRSAGIEAALAHLGGSLDRLVLASGVGPTVGDARLIPRINLYGTLEVLDGLRPALQAGDHPSAVLLSSHSATMLPEDDATVASFLEGEVEADAAALGTDPAIAYAASKRALTGRMRERSIAWGESGVRLNAVAPGPVKTGLLDATLASEAYGDAARALPVPLGRWAEPEEIAAVVAFLSSPAAGIVHGSVWFADGGTDALIRPRTY